LKSVKIALFEHKMKHKDQYFSHFTTKWYELRGKTERFKTSPKFSVNSLSGSVKVLAIYKIMYFLEYDADRFAAKIVGKDAYTSMLKTLDGVTGGKLTKGDFLHPNLEKRIRNVEKYVP
jgi:hypothetical protein